MKKLCDFKCPKIPVVRKCCFCIPTYVGIAVFGYADLTLALVAFPMLMYEMVDELTSDKPRGEMRYSDPAVHLPVIVAAALADIVLTVVLLIGAHRKNKLLLKIYFYFATISQLVTLLADLPFYDYSAHRKNAVYLFYVGLNIYLLFLVHNVVYVREDKRDIQYIAYDQHQVTV
ncbi:uncharacterized protein LOC111356747 [Spodoptera litura]|uniref:Uncharacterized protein LOC111356747 n=1 Tax=Spodoptera litura TaxID=69820 RepID=A0A9J7EBF8_SPOLT|nr:uncharacterized protein LOC111356747 [Spodoptera litura]